MACCLKDWWYLVIKICTLISWVCSPTFEVQINLTKPYYIYYSLKEQLSSEITNFLSN